MSNKDKIIELRGVTFAYPETDNRPVLDNISLTVYAGEMLALLGPNGSGKSTLARLMNGLLLPTGGCVLINGIDTAREDARWEIKKQVGMVFQNPDNQLVAATAEEELAFGMENLGLAPQEMRQRIQTISARLQLQPLLAMPPHRLSGGQKQRLAVASVLVLQPQVLVLDEPTSMLDPAGRQEVLAELRRIKQDGQTVVLVTHDMTEALAADRVVVLEQGKIVFEGTPRACFSDAAWLTDQGLAVPPAVELAHRIRQKGLAVPKDLFQVADWVDFLCQKSSR
ncbi:energy-coupling factor transporter ATPase [Desulforamulus hydrothermalis]|uniref:Energy-coupling factor transporter ATP-binding protein EcfA 2 n=1 Tax=Desulforamulus hydrothermalis Lam5 = DSM 18033 TaxID=1121428 RepID=K8DYC7_9FIRM|nr:energy-coupling factor transporter ATPase [Desulforamulus hydrothermalis]CCO07827.1 Energy-coupling factor transporter ATP-binding protein EcfA 2 [Desulforamulus hydrothermalis Lam5 = DSM 18033]SHH27135.1 energy-coupling factor transport system ATP-binding protein [Desulforamulus hydrothermalis Lam5 = DSM 18033]